MTYKRESTTLGLTEENRKYKSIYTLCKLLWLKNRIRATQKEKQGSTVSETWNSITA